MLEYIDKGALVAEIERTQKILNLDDYVGRSVMAWSEGFKNFINTLEVKDPYEECIQYDSIKAGIQANAEIYSFNIESKLFNQLAKEQQGLWREEIEQAYIIGGDTGVELARDPRYKENLEVKDTDLNEEIKSYFKGFGKFPSVGIDDCIDIAKHFYELGLKAQKGK